MKKLLLAIVLISTSATAADPAYLWPADRTPYAQGATEIDLPYVYAYPVPEGQERSGASVVVCPGGGYGGLAIDHEGNQIAQWFNQLGMDVFVLHYRLGSKGYHYPTQLADVQRAIRYARSKAVDPDRVGVCGFSAGGHLASMAATKFATKAYEASDALDELSARPNFAVLCYPVISMKTGVTHGGSRKNLLGPDRVADDELAASLSSEDNVTAETPPCFIFQTSEDAAVPAENALRMALALHEKDIPCELHLYQKGVHGVGLFQGDPILSTWSGHLSDWLRTNGMLVASDEIQRVPITGFLTLDDTPVSWGSVTFHPENKRLPVTTARVRNGRFSLKADEGPVVGPSTIGFAASIWEATQDSADRVITTDQISPSTKEKVSVNVQSGLAPLKFDLKSSE